MIYKNSIFPLALLAIMLAVLGIKEMVSAGGSCLAQNDGTYHISYYEFCGNAEQPVTKGNEETVTLWFEIDSPDSAYGKVYVDNLYLERSDRPGVNQLQNAGFEKGLWWGRKNNAMCVSSDTWCQNIVETDDTFVWRLGALLSRNSKTKKITRNNFAFADMSRLGRGWQTHIFHPLLNIKGIPKGISWKASAEIIIEGNLQVRLGIDFRDSPVSPSDPRANIRAINGLVYKGSTYGKTKKIILRNNIL